PVGHPQNEREERQRRRAVTREPWDGHGNRGPPRRNIPRGEGAKPGIWPVERMGRSRPGISPRALAAPRAPLRGAPSLLSHPDVRRDRIAERAGGLLLAAPLVLD